MYDYDLGQFGRKVSTQSDEAQLWCDRGLTWVYGFNHEEAITCFEKAIAADPGCALAHWGIVYSLGPNYNKPWETFEPEEKQALVDRLSTTLAAAQATAGSASPVEQALIGALPARCPTDVGIEDFGPLNDAYADAMRKIYAAHPHDNDVAALTAEALMNRTPWQLWDLPAGKPAEGADTLEAKEILETAFTENDGAWDHPGLLHMYIHLMEMSPTPELALRHGDRLAELVPDAGHLVHMATHIDVLCGNYQDVVERNHRAIIADRKYLAEHGAENFYTVYRCHNYHFKIYGAMFLGQPGPALETADELIATLPADVLAPMADWFEAFVPMKQHVLVRFGMWEEILAQELPEDEDLFSVTTAMMRYARTVALANLHRIGEAEAERDAFMAARDAVQESRMLFNNTCHDILKVAEQMMLGELHYHKGEQETAFQHLERAIHLDDSLPYDEPWGWMQPVRHALGALLLDAGRYEEAEAVYRADLGLDPTLARACQHPNNVWSLHGLNECLTHRGEEVERRIIANQLAQAMARSDVVIRASCYCRQKKAA